jgi:translation initiation factor 2B subunit (eIF-2B alpha/beta/delta family)
MGWRDQQAAIMTDPLSGAMGITNATIEMLRSFTREAEEYGIVDLLHWLQKIALEIITAQSGMASLAILFNELFWVTDTTLPVQQNLKQLQRALQEYQARQDKNRSAICRATSAFLPSNVKVITHSASSTVGCALSLAENASKAPHVHVMEARPLCEGKLFAQKMAKKGIKTTFFIDAAAYTNLSTCEVVMLGVDSLTENGIVAKIGTAGLAVSAKSLGIPCYFLADTRKVWPAVLGKQPIHERNPGDIWDDAPANVVVQNRFYDITPWEAVSGIISENGILSETEVKQLSQQTSVHPLLQNVIAEVRSTI